MKRLMILRHAKSNWGDEEVSDFNRKLNKRGVRNANSMGEFLDAKHGKPDLIVSSSAVRAYETAKIVAEKMSYSINKIITRDDLYLAWVSDLINAIQALPDKVENCLLVGHNPGLTDLVNHLGVRLDNLPTASVVCFEFDTQDWSNIGTENADLKWFQLARDLN